MHIVVFITAANRKEADLISEALVKRKLVACVNITERVESVFWWKGKVEHAKELLLMAKSRKSKFSQIVKAVKSLHSYDVPEIIALPVVCGSDTYLRWINDSLR